MLICWLKVLTRKCFKYFLINKKISGNHATDDLMVSGHSHLRTPPKPEVYSESFYYLNILKKLCKPKPEPLIVALKSEKDSNNCKMNVQPLNANFTPVRSREVYGGEGLGLTCRRSRGLASASWWAEHRRTWRPSGAPSLWTAPRMRDR